MRDGRRLAVSERKLQQDIRLALGLMDGCAFWRQNVGQMKIDGRRVKFGLCTGSSDLIGIVDGRFCALEVKLPGQKPTNSQLQFLFCVRLHGGFGAVVHSVEEALAAIERCRREESE